MDRQRMLNAAYLQNAFPVLSSHWAPDSSLRITLTAGLRYEGFSDVGSAFMPSFGFAVDLDSGVSLTGTWARMFRPPNLSDTDESLNYAEVYPVLNPDPKSPTSYTMALI